MLHGLHPWRMPLANYLKMPKRQAVIALLALKWSFRRIERETGVRRETVASYARQADPNPAKTFPGSGGIPGPDSQALVEVDGSNPAKTFPGSGPNPAKTFPGTALPPRFAAAAFHDAITEKLDAGLTIQRIYQDLVEDFSYGYSYESVKRYVRQLAPKRRAAGVMHSLPGEEALCGTPHSPSYAAPGNMRRPPKPMTLMAVTTTVASSRTPHKLQPFQEGDEGVVWPVSPGACFRRCRSCEGFLFEA